MKYTLLLFVAFTIIACSKADKEPPQIEFLTPKGSDTFSVGVDSFLLNFKLSDNDKLSHYSYVIKDSFDVKYLTQGNFISESVFEHKSYIMFGGFSGVQKLWLYVTAYDKAYNSKVLSTEFYIQP